MDPASSPLPGAPRLHVEWETVGRRAAGGAAGDRAGAAVERRGRSPRRYRLAAQSFVSARAVSNETQRLRHQGVRPVIATAGSRLAAYRRADTLSRLTSS